MPFVAVTLNESLKYTLGFVCRTCGYALDFVKNIQQTEIVDIIEDYNLKDCPNCTGGEFNYRFCSVYTTYLTLPFNGLCFRVMRDGHYLRESYENPCSLNVCTCERRMKFTDNYSLLSWNRNYPFVCGQCSKFFLHEEQNRRTGESFGFFRSFQINILIHSFDGEHIDLTDLDNIRHHGMHFDYLGGIYQRRTS
jgi:hypothetical protein